jgi:hypothetical protein
MVLRAARTSRRGIETVERRCGKLGLWLHARRCHNPDAAVEGLAVIRPNATSMASFGRTLGALAAAIALADCGARAPVAPKPDFPPPAWRVDAAAVQSLRSVCIEDLEIPEALPEAAAREKAFVELLRAEFARANVALVAEDRTKEVYGRACRNAGGAFDAETGTAEPAQYAKARGAGLAALRRDLQCDALMTAALVVVSSVWETGVARWDGVRQALPGANGQGSGTVPAVTLWIYLTDTKDREIYFGAGGVQVLMGLKKRGPYAASEGVVVDAKTVLASEELNRKSVEVALAPFLSARAGGGEETATSNPGPADNRRSAQPETTAD